MAEFDLITLPNGIRLVHKQVASTKIAHVGIMLDVGSRDESPDQLGIAHFWEHMAFKGTKKRKSFHILNRLDSLGGELNAYTTKEKICFYASVLDLHLEKALELLTDITFNSTFPEKQIEKERNVILEEMSMYKDNPEDAIMDDFDEVVFTKHPLGHNILGTQETVGGFSQSDFKRFLEENLDSERMVVSTVGNFSLQKIERLVRKHLNDSPTFSSSKQRKLFGPYRPSSLSEVKPITQAQCAIGRPAYKIADERRIPFFMLANILGGPGMNSRLNMALREKYGYVYSIDANYNPYVDTGLFSVFFGTDPRHISRSFQLIRKEFAILRERKLGEVQFHKAREQLMGQLAMSEENNGSMMLMMAKSLLDMGSVPSLENVFQDIRKITREHIIELANEMLVDDDMSTLVFVPENGKVNH
ncbi:pitrilysin family protein [uncultured Imperialibacter sp.]|uniref:M16 family metallopeptidase n=1 Tax=uncultured Imperialibacter sp. TaxID=1672639 RepID=UPI0030DC3DF3|tara:strand:- start:9917 stop:11167 length:1251 start_codon:yes stop_codon:yes gene_type:complete